MRTGFADLPLHAGKCPPWLFARMKRLGAAITAAIVYEHGEKEFLQRISNPFFFQSLGCVLAFDWHSSGLTTTVCGALKEGLSLEEHGIAVAGGKGKTSRKTPSEIVEKADAAGLEADQLVRASRLAAKVDSAAVQDGFQLYHHCLFFSRQGDWAVVQQGLKAPENAGIDWLGAVKDGRARRYHWLSDGLKSFVNEPHAAVCADEKNDGAVLNLVAAESSEARKASVDLVNEGTLLRDGLQRTLAECRAPARLTMQRNHLIDARQYKALANARECCPENYEQLLLCPGVGPKTVRALALVGEIVYGAEPSWKDPARYSWAHGGKDFTPYPPDKPGLEASALFLEEAVDEARLEKKEKLEALKRLSAWLAARRSQ